MKYKFEYVNDQFCQMYFSFSVKEVNELFIEAKEDNIVNDEDILDYIKSKIDEDILEDKLDELEIITIGPRLTNFMTDIKAGKPLMGITRCCVLPEDINLSLPTEIPEAMYNFQIDDETIETLIHSLLISNNLYEIKDVDVVSDDCIVTYDLCYMKDDLILNKIENQTTDTDTDIDIDFNKFKNKKVNGKITIDKDEVNTVAIIKKIEKKVPYELTNEVVSKLRFGSIKTKKGLFDKVRSVLEFQKDIQTAVFYIVESIHSTNQINFEDNVIEFFLKGLPEIEANNKKEIIDNIKRMLITEILIKVIELKTDDEDISPELYKKLDDLSKLIFIADGRKSQSLLRDMFDDQIRQLKLLEFCKETGMVSNIKI